MNASASSAIRILFIHDTQNDAEPVANAIRNSGQAVRSHFIASLDELSHVLEEQTWDLMIAKLNTDTVDVSDATGMIQRDGKDLPIIGLIDEYDSEIISSALDMGMVDVIVESAEQHLVQAAKREMASLADRRNLRTQRITLRETEKRCQLLLESSVDAIGYVHEGMHIYANPIYMKMFGYDDLEELQCTPIMDLVASAQVNKLKEALKSNPEGDTTEFTTIGEHSDGSNFDIQMSFSAASYEGEPCTQVVIRRNTANNEALEERIKEISSLDIATGLHNRIYFNEQLEKAYEQAVMSSKRQLVVHLGFTNFNEIKSQANVSDLDEVLKPLADALKQYIRDAALLARYSDEMFALMFPTADLASVQTKLEHMQDKIADMLFEAAGKTVQVQLVSGIAHIDESCKSGNEALVHADQAYSQAVKQNTKTAYFDKSDIANLADNSLITKIDHALTHDKLRVQFQPVMSLRGDSKEHYDVLVRLTDKDGSDVLPKEFLPALENSDLNGKLDRWVVENALIALSGHRKRGNNTQIMVHLTPASIQDPTFLPWVNSQLKEKMVPGDAVCFQITEAIALSYLKAAKAFSKGLSLLKCQLSINHFGMSDKGMGLTRHLDINYASIDGSYVEDLVKTGQTSSKLIDLLKSIHQNDINSIVPKIENAEVLAALWELGVNYIQGYYLQAPLDGMNYNFDADEEEVG
ncbi:MAG: EAL domain-containing protein [Reinekea sp.]|jgi:multidomain signaling protein FimX